MLLIFIAFICSGMSQPVMLESTTLDIARENAISDFLKCRLSRKSSVFSVSMYERGTHDRYEIVDDIIVVLISPIENTEPYYRITLVDTLGSTRLPTRHIIKNGKLFYWHDPDFGLTEEVINAFLEFNLAQPINISDLSMLLGYEGYYGNTEAAQYYFCKNDLSNYKRVITGIAPGWYKPPKVNCR